MTATSTLAARRGVAMSQHIPDRAVDHLPRRRTERVQCVIGWTILLAGVLTLVAAFLASSVGLPRGSGADRAGRRRSHDGGRGAARRRPARRLRPEPAHPGQLRRPGRPAADRAGPGDGQPRRGDTGARRGRRQRPGGRRAADARRRGVLRGGSRRRRDLGWWSCCWCSPGWASARWSCPATAPRGSGSGGWSSRSGAAGPPPDRGSRRAELHARAPRLVLRSLRPRRRAGRRPGSWPAGRAGARGRRRARRGHRGRRTPPAPRRTRPSPSSIPVPRRTAVSSSGVTSR